MLLCIKAATFFWFYRKIRSIEQKRSMVEGTDAKGALLQKCAICIWQAKLIFIIGTVYIKNSFIAFSIITSYNKRKNAEGVYR